MASAKAISPELSGGNMVAHVVSSHDDTRPRGQSHPSDHREFRESHQAAIHLNPSSALRLLIRKPRIHEHAAVLQRSIHPWTFPAEIYCRRFWTTFSNI